VFEPGVLPGALLAFRAIVVAPAWEAVVADGSDLMIRTDDHTADLGVLVLGTLG
jgi:hypothetical protein